MLVAASLPAAAHAGSAARIQVTPRETEVYVDGYRAGIVDDFDGFTQRLHVPPGEHVIELYLDGHRPVTQTILFQPGETYRIRHAMEPLAAGEAEPARPTPRTPPVAPGAPPAYDALGRPIQGSSAPSSAGVGAGVIAIRVQPADAVVLVDGERWQGSSGDRLEIQVSPGSHRIDVQKDGYQPFNTNVQVRPGETATVNISLTRTGEVK
jgi:PEGA domain